MTGQLSGPPGLTLTDTYRTVVIMMMAEHEPLCTQIQSRDARETLSGSSPFLSHLVGDSRYKCKHCTSENNLFLNP